MQLVKSDWLAEAMKGVDPNSPVARLTRKEIEVTLLASDYRISKEIAKQLNISSHTVDARFRSVLDKLDMDDRRDAARMVRDALLPDSETYQRLIHQSPYVDAASPLEHQEATVGITIRHADRAGEASLSGVTTEQILVGLGSPLQLPFATRSHPSNEMSVGLRLIWIVMIAMSATFSAGMYLAGLESLSRMIGS